MGGWRRGRIRDVKRQAGRKPTCARRLCRRVQSEQQSRLLALQATVFRGDDGVEFLDATELDRLITAAPDATHIRIVMDDSSMSIELIR
ncbi:DUF3085 domain-containing protein [Rhizobium sp. CB3060]|uniref:DUF3085 domain-containing protein n=1 Tax=Rhizobium sp. CB3060 TaxID=3138255 RepID=UPI004053F268